MDANPNGFWVDQEFVLVWVAVVTFSLLTLIAMPLGAGEADNSQTSKSVVSENMINRWRKGNAKLGISLTVQVSKATYRSGEKIEAEMLIRNDSGKPVQVYVPGLHGRIKSSTKPQATGNSLSTDVQMVFGRPARRDRSDNVTLEPGEFLGRKFKLDQARAGEFTVTASYTTNPNASEYLLVVKSSVLKVTD